MFHQKSRYRCAVAFLLCVFLIISVSRLFAASPTVVRLKIDATKRGNVIGNKVSTINLWQLQTWPIPPIDEGANLSEFVDWVQFMQATGGNSSRDLFVEPDNTEVVDDYQFDSLIDKCRAVLQLGAKPTIKLSVPNKFSKESIIGVFGVDVLPPDDYEVYYRYIRAMAKELVEAFGLDEVRLWRFGVLVEFENADWFHDKEKTPEGSKSAYFKLYDHSVAALEAELGDDVWVGAHAMACTEGLWDERDLLDHCVEDVNSKTGEKGTTIKYFAVSFYDDAPDRPHPMSLAETIARIRERAEAVGLRDLRYGVDEGRILGASKGRYATDLTFRIVGQTYQAAYDARLFKIMVDSNIDYFSMWSYSSSSAWSGYPLLAYRVAQNVAKFKDSKRLEVVADQMLAEGVDCNGVAGFDEESETLYATAYNFKYDLNYDGAADVECVFNAPFWKGRNVEIIETIIDDSNNFFCDWLVDKERLQIPDDAFSWSPDSGCLDVGFIDPEVANKYRTELRVKYVEKARRAPDRNRRVVKVGDDGSIVSSVTLARHAVVFYEIKPVD